MTEAGPPSNVAEGVTITVERELDHAVVDSYQRLYQETFGPLARIAVARQVLHPDEFVAEMHDERVMKYVARNAAGEVIGLSTLTRDLETVPWISPDYFARRYPEHTARNAVFYLGFTLVDPRGRRAGVFMEMIRAMMVPVLRERGVCGWDMCAYNEQNLGFTPMIEAFLSQYTELTMAELDTQIYHSVDLHGPPVE